MAKRRFGSERMFRIRIIGYFCVYCGEIATQDEHFPPMSYSLHGYILPACAECNSLAGTNYPTDFVNRASRVKERLRNRYQHQMETPDWSQEEIDEFGRNLKAEVLKWEKTTRIAKERIAWNAISYLASIDQCNDFVQTYAEEDFLEQNRWKWSEKQKKY